MAAGGGVASLAEIARQSEAFNAQQEEIEKVYQWLQKEGAALTDPEVDERLRSISRSFNEILKNLAEIEQRRKILVARYVQNNSEVTTMALPVSETLAAAGAAQTDAGAKNEVKGPMS